MHTLWTLPALLIRCSVWLLTHTLYRIRIVGPEHVPVRGPALLVCNHISFIDGLLVGGCVKRCIRFLIYRPIYEHKALHWMLRHMQAIPVQGGNAKDVVQSLARAQEELRQGHVVCIFAEGAISRTGNLLPFKRGFERIIKGVDVPVIPVHLDRVWGSIFSFKDGRFFWTWPRRLPYPVTVSFGAPLPSTVTAQEVRQRIAALGSAAVEQRRTARDLLHLRFIEMAKRHWFSGCMSDSTGSELTYVVTAVPDAQKGERLVVLYTHTECTPDVLWAQLCQTALPKLWIPRREHFYAVETIPLLGTGKVDLRAARHMALTMMATGGLGPDEVQALL